MQKVLVTGAAGFIGSRFCKFLLELGTYQVFGLDNFDPFYAETTKRQNLNPLISNPFFRFETIDIVDYDKLMAFFPDNAIVVHLAAKAGVRPSIDNPMLYQDVNVRGTQNMLDVAHKKNCKQFVFASSSSVYGVSPQTPWREQDSVLMPISPYAATKVAGELLGHVYAHLYEMRFLALRFFTVIGPGQRPDLAVHKFIKAIIHDEELTLYGQGNTQRDYTYVDDVVAAIHAAMHYQGSMYEIFNIGNNQPVTLRELVRTIEKVMNKKAKIKHLPEQPGDVPITFADINKAQKALNYHPKTSLEAGIEAFVNWHLTQMAER
ncbi:MAG: NAD-dependent epimerase/dehydratase family protein [Cytophagales bacterium]|nr:MAG: NAD-dependent epimerase/dehydratase family protein [Cytophagales bacterium]TAF61116.1 MAG: NAD-dependent epimerase/dehydratase family protein [Cytophagales bacterium]